MLPILVFLSDWLLRKMTLNWEGLINVVFSAKQIIWMYYTHFSWMKR